MKKIDISEEVHSGRWFSLKNYQDEQWENVPGYENLYSLSNYGRLKHLPYSLYGLNKERVDIGEKIRKPNLMRTGYYAYELWKENKRKVYLLHRLLAIIFIPNPLMLPQINHIDGNKQNDNLSNLEWCTPRENIIHAINVLGVANGRNYKYGKEHYRAKPVCAVNEFGEIIMQFDCMQDAYRQTGIRESGISSCVRGKQKTAGGFIWRTI